MNLLPVLQTRQRDTDIERRLGKWIEAVECKGDVDIEKHVEGFVSPLLF